MKKKNLSWGSKAAKSQYLEKLMSNVKAEATDYKIDQNYIVGEYINHFKFGHGFIQKVVNPTKIEVYFKGFEKLLLQNRTKA